MIELKAREGSIEIPDDEWCRVSVVIGARRFILGAEKRDTVITRLRGAVEAAIGGKAAGKRDGVGVNWLMSLSEQHGSMYGADVDGGRKFYFQDRAANELGTITVSADERAAWRTALG